MKMAFQPKTRRCYSALIYGIQVEALDDKCIKYFIKALKVNRPLSVVKRNIMDIPTLKQLIQVCMGHGNARVYKALFLCDFFKVFHLSNLPSHTVHGFDPLKQLGGGGGWRCHVWQEKGNVASKVG